MIVLYKSFVLLPVPRIVFSFLLANAVVLFWYVVTIVTSFVPAGVVESSAISSIIIGLLTSTGGSVKKTKSCDIAPMCAGDSAVGIEEVITDILLFLLCSLTTGC